MLLTLWGEGPSPLSVEPPSIPCPLCGFCLPLTCFYLYSDRVSVNFLKRLGLLGWGWNDGKEEKKIASSWQNKDPFSSSFSSPKQSGVQIADCGRIGPREEGFVCVALGMIWSPQLYSLWTVLWLWKQRAPTGNLGFNYSVFEGGMDDPKQKK